MAILTEQSADVIKRMVDEIDHRTTFTDLMISPKWRDCLVLATEQPKQSGGQNPIYAGFTSRYHGIPYNVVDIPSEEVLDWSGCRSPSRAKRRHARGIPQRVKISYRERAFLVNAQAFNARVERMMMKTLFGE